MIFASVDEYQVFKRQTRLSINLEKRHCSCGKWTLTWISYRNVIYCMAHKRVDLKEYCHKFYKVQTFRRTYNEMVLYEKEVVVLSPSLKRNVGSISVFAM